MPEPKRAILQVEAEGDIRVSEIAKFLTAIENAYSGALVLFKTIEMLPRLDRHLDFPLHPLMAFWPSVPIASRRGKTRLLDSTSIASAVGRPEALVVKSVRLESPGH